MKNGVLLDAVGFCRILKSRSLRAARWSWCGMRGTWHLRRRSHCPSATADVDAFPCPWPRSLVA